MVTFAINTNNPHLVVMEAENFARQVDQLSPMAQVAMAACWTDNRHPMEWSSSRGMEFWRAKIVAVILQDVIAKLAVQS